MKRTDGWESLLNYHIEKHFCMERKWGRVDCCFFIVDWIELATGVDTGGDFRNKYRSRSGAYKAIEKYSGSGFDEAIDMLAEKFLMKEINPLLGQRGDVVTVPGNGSNALGLISSNGRDVLVQGKNGLDVVPITSAVKCWRVG